MSKNTSINLNTELIYEEKCPKRYNRKNVSTDRGRQEEFFLMTEIGILKCFGRFEAAVRKRRAFWWLQG
jgi:hypothetical protein